MKILWLAHENSLSGANKCLFEFIQLLKEDGNSSFVITPKGDELTNALSNLVDKSYQIPFYHWVKAKEVKYSIFFRLKRLLRNTFAIYEVIRVIKELKPDYVVTNTVTTPVLAIASFFTRKKHIWIIHEFGEEDHGYTIGRNFKSSVNIMNRLSLKLVFVSNSIKEKYQQFVTESKLAVVYNPVLNNYDELQKKQKKKSYLNAIVVGQIAESKNYLEVLKAIDICNDMGLVVNLNITGKIVSKTYHRLLLDFIHTNNLDKQVSFTGYSETPSILMADNDLLIMSSRSEGFGRVTVEALQLGVPVVGANSGGTKEIVDDNVNGYLYESGNYMDLANKMILFSSNINQFDSKKISQEIKQKFNGQQSLNQLRKVFN